MGDFPMIHCSSSSGLRPALRIFSSRSARSSSWRRSRTFEKNSIASSWDSPLRKEGYTELKVPKKSLGAMVYLLSDRCFLGWWYEIPRRCVGGDIAGWRARRRRENEEQRDQVVRKEMRMAYFDINVGGSCWKDRLRRVLLREEREVRSAEVRGFLMVVND